MATIDVGTGHGGRRTVSHEIPLIPFIDFLLCLVAFLLVTAVWSQMARIQADAKVPNSDAPVEPTTLTPERELHIEVRDQRRFQLVWREGSTVINTVDVERTPVSLGTDGDYGFPALGQRVMTEWLSAGSHRAPTDPKLDRAVLHADNTVPFADLAAVMDAVHSAKRSYTSGAKTEIVPAFNLSFAVN